MFLHEVLSAYVDRKTNLKPSSVEQLRYSIGALERCFGGPVDIALCTEVRLAQWVRDRLLQVSAATAKRNLSGVLLLLRFAAKKLGKNITVPEVEAVNVPRQIPTAWTVAQIGRILAVAERLPGTMRRLPVSRASWWTALILFLYDSGARIQAALAVEPHDLDLETRTCVLRGECAKTGTEQIVDLGADTCDALRTLLEEQDGALLPLQVFPFPWASRKLWLEFHAILEAAGVPAGRYVGFHRLRKTHATQQVIAVGWEQARVALGHTSEGMTRRYVDLRQLPRSGAILPRPRQ